MPTEIDGVLLGNRVSQNSCQGQLATDEGSWSSKTAVLTGKIHTLCCKHKANAISDAMSGLEELGSPFRHDMNTLIYSAIKSQDELDSMSEKCQISYGHNAKSKAFIDSVHQSRAKPCATITQYIFIYSHCPGII